MRRIAGHLAFTLSVLLAPAAGLAAEGDFAGKSIRVLVAFTAGGPVDVYARLLARHLRDHIPGGPTLIVQNMTGAGGVTAMNYLYNVAPKDGTAIGVSVGPFTNQFIGGGGVKYDSPKFYWLGGENISQVSYIHKGLGVRVIADLPNATTQIVIGGLRPDSSRDLRMRAFLDSIGIRNFKYVSGYPGTGAVRTALLREEVNFSDEAATTIVSELSGFVRDGTVTPIVQSGLTRGSRTIRDPRLPDVPTAAEAAAAIKGEAVLGTVAYRATNLVIAMSVMNRAILMPPGVNAAAGDAVRKAIVALGASETFQNEAVKQTGSRMEFIEGSEAQRLAEDTARLMSEDKEAAQYLQAMIKERN